MADHEVEIKAILLETADDLQAEGFASEMDRDMRDAGAYFIRNVIQQDIYLSHPARDLFATDEAFRVRSEEEAGKTRLMLTYKGPKVSKLSKARLEKEVFLDGTDIERLLEILSYLGFGKVLTVIKSRRFYLLDDVEVDLDNVRGLGVFCEMEIQSDDIEGAEGRIMMLMEKMGFKRFERRSYLELLLSKQI
ncbi:MAG: class IV adenylate cyclase [Candidatus Thermoplasmatota archaeon]|nr:class IV adenylate cyclase [Candidatus Thermoplasmatota archaeon]